MDDITTSSPSANIKVEDMPKGIYRAPTGEYKKHVIYAEPLLTVVVEKQCKAIGDAHEIGLPFYAEFNYSNGMKLQYTYFHIYDFYRELWNFFRNDPQGSVKIHPG